MKNGLKEPKIQISLLLRHTQLSPIILSQVRLFSDLGHIADSFLKLQTRIGVHLTDIFQSQLLTLPCIKAQCNSCGCSNGNIISTKRKCSEDSCFYYGVEYKHGSTIPKADGCNKCTCSNGKADTCTKLPCPPSKVTQG